MSRYTVTFTTDASLGYLQWIAERLAVPEFRVSAVQPSEDTFRVVLTADDTYAARTHGLSLAAAIERDHKITKATIRQGYGMFAGPTYDLFED